MAPECVALPMMIPANLPSPRTSLEWRIHIRPVEGPSTSGEVSIVIRRESPPNHSTAGWPFVTTADIDSFDYLSVESIMEPEANRLRMEICAGLSNEDPRLFEVFWADYLAYQVVNESFSRCDDYDEYEGRLFVKYSKSRYLDFVIAAPSIHFEYAEFAFKWSSVTHWGLRCLDHTIDVISNNEPEIRELEPTWEKCSIVRARFEEMLAKNREESIAATVKERLAKTQSRRLDGQL